MGRRWIAAPLVAAALALAGPAAARVSVVTTTTDLAAIARAIGGEQVSVVSLALGTQDPHFVDPKPSFIVKLNRADLYVKRGLDLEIGWAPVLEKAARNPNILYSAPGYVDASAGVPVLGLPGTKWSRALGDVHPYGSPHYQLDPVRAKIMARNIADGLIRIDPEHRSGYEQRLAAFDREVDRRLAGWASLMAPYRGAKIVTYHQTWDYFADRFGLEIIGTMEPKPGVAPSPAHLARLITQMRAQHCRLLIRSPYYPENLTHIVAETTGATVLVLPESPGGVPGTDDYFSFIDYDVRQVATALAAPAKR